jgi:hypothetical protein
MFRPTRIIRVTTKQEFDSALRSADQVIVEGDDELLSYAVTKASEDPQNRVSVEFGERSISVGDCIVVEGGTVTPLRDAHSPPEPAMISPARQYVRARRGGARFRQSLRSSSLC